WRTAAEVEVLDGPYPAQLHRVLPEVLVGPVIDDPRRAIGETQRYGAVHEVPSGPVVAHILARPGGTGFRGILDRSSLVRDARIAGGTEVEGQGAEGARVVHRFDRPAPAASVHVTRANAAVVVGDVRLAAGIQCEAGGEGIYGPGHGLDRPGSSRARTV